MKHITTTIAIAALVASTSAVAEGYGARQAAEKLARGEASQSNNDPYIRTERQSYSLERLDTNNDGQITRTEFENPNNPGRRNFHRADANNDGVISREELQSFNERAYGTSTNR